ncbi:hypothetical protein BDQ17DRAFT_1512961 [Cyathus striatus]|nr:hypothetical protein BDQ17DRAFT_1512961 [Cyathus striatus]
MAQQRTTPIPQAHLPTLTTPIPSSTSSKRGYRLCDECGAIEGPSARFRLCGGCMTTQYCSQECQKRNWPTHKSLCQHTTSQLHAFSNPSPAAGDENLTKNLRKFTTLRVPLNPSAIRHHALLIELTSSPSKSKFKISQTHIVPLTYVRDALVIKDIQRRDERCRANGGLGAMVVLLQCGSVSQVMPVEVDRPECVGWSVRDEWEGVVRGWVESGRGEFRAY